MQILKTHRIPAFRPVMVGLMLLATTASAQDSGWSFRASMPTPRVGAMAAAFGNDIYVVGGMDGLGRILDVVERYDPVTDRWETGLPPLPAPRAHAAAVVFEGRLYVIGGRDPDGKVREEVWSYDPGENRWTPFEDLDREREGAAAVILDEAPYVVGGSGEDGEMLDTATYFDDTTGHWEQSQGWHLDLARASFAAAVVGPSVYSIGGFSRFGPVGAVQRYDPGVGDAVMASLYPPRGSLAAAAVGDSIYVACGRGPGDLPVNEVDRFLPEQNRWEQLAPLNLEREDCAMVAAGNTLFVIGGRDLYGAVLGTVEALTPARAVAVETPARPRDFRLEQNYPNPFFTGRRPRPRRARRVRPEGPTGGGVAGANPDAGDPYGVVGRARVGRASRRRRYVRLSPASGGAAGYPEPGASLHPSSVKGLPDRCAGRAQPCARRARSYLKPPLPGSLPALPGFLPEKQYLPLTPLYCTVHTMPPPDGADWHRLW